MRQCDNATLFSACRKSLSRKRNPLSTCTSPRISAKPSGLLPPRKMVASPRFSVSVVAKKVAFSPPKTRLSDEKDTQKRYKNALAWYDFAHFTHQKKHFFWRVKQRQPPDFCPVFDTQNRKIAKKRCRFYVAPQPRHKKSVGFFLHRHRKSPKLGSDGRLECRHKFGLISPASHGRMVARSLGRLMKSLCCQWLWGNPGIGKPPNGGKVGFRSANGWMRGCQSVSKRAMLRSRKERRFASHCLRMAISSSYELTR